MSNPTSGSEVQDVYELVLETAPTLHPARRARVYRGLSLIIGDERFAADLLKRAAASDELQRQDKQLLLRFRAQRT
jgi:hypothetical protein